MARSLVLVATLAAVLAAGTAACGASGHSAGTASTASTAGTPTGTKPGASVSAPSAAVTSAPATSAPPATGAPSATGNPLAALTPQQIARRAVDDTAAAPQVRLSGTLPASSQTVSLDLTVVAAKGCEGSITEPGAGSFKLVDNRTTIWFLPDAQFYQKYAHLDASQAALLTGKWLAVPAATSSLASLAQVCTLKELFSNLSTSATMTAGAATTFDGQPSVPLYDSTDVGYIYVSDTGKPELLRLGDANSARIHLDFSYTGIPDTITPPPASEVIDASKYGF